MFCDFCYVDFRGQRAAMGQHLVEVMSFESGGCGDRAAASAKSNAKADGTGRYKNKTKSHRSPLKLRSVDIQILSPEA